GLLHRHDHSLLHRRFGQGEVFNDLGPRLDLPNNLEFFARAVVLDRRAGEQVLRALESGLEGRGREGAGAHLVDDPLRGAGADQWALFGWGVSHAAHGAALGGAIRRRVPWPTGGVRGRVPRIALPYTDCGAVSSTAAHSTRASSSAAAG